MCTNNVGVARRIDLESISEDLAALIRQLGHEVEGAIEVAEVRKIETKLKRLVEE
jgi:hypothetical protein